MTRSVFRRLPARLLSEHGLLLALVLLCGFLSVLTLAEQYTPGAAGGEELAREILGQTKSGTTVVIVAGHGVEDAPFAEALAHDLGEGGLVVIGQAVGRPSQARQELERLHAESKKPDLIAASHLAGRWELLRELDAVLPSLAGTKVYRPRTYSWPNFLMPRNLLNITSQIAIIAILAIGMTLVIIAGGIDLSVGSLIALSAVVATLLIRDVFGAADATTGGMIASALAAIAVCALVGLANGLTVTACRLPAFIVTLSVMLMASGLASILARGQSVSQVPDSFVWLGRGANLAGIPNAVVLAAVLYVIAHVVMSRMTLGRYIYAVGGNPEAARLAGVPVRRVLLLVYTVCGALAGLGGVVMASQLQSGAPIYGVMYELYVIAAVVVGGTSLSGGEGRVFGTLLGALLIAVIQNGMNLTRVESYTQKVVLGGVILTAVLLDRLKKRAR